MERYGGADKSAECRGTVSTLFCGPTRCRPQGSFTSGEDARLETGLLIRRAGCGKAASPDLWGRRRATAASTRPLGTPPIGQSDSRNRPKGDVRDDAAIVRSTRISDHSIRKAYSGFPSERGSSGPHTTTAELKAAITRDLA